MKKFISSKRKGDVSENRGGDVFLRTGNVRGGMERGKGWKTQGMFTRVRRKDKKET